MGKAVAVPPKKEKKPAKAKKTEQPKGEKKAAKGKGVSKSKSKSRSPARGRSASKSKSPVASKSRSPMKKADKKGAAGGKAKASPAKKAKKQPQEEGKAARSKTKSPKKKSVLNQLQSEAAAAKGGKKQVSKEAKEKKKDPHVDENNNYVHEPKAAASGYRLFMADFLDDNDDLGKGGFTTAGAAWKGLAPEAKAPYEAKAAEDKTRREKQLEEKAEKGYFTTADGGKSTDLPDPRARGARYPPETVLPKKAQGNYFCWLNANRAQIRGEGDDALSATEVLKEAGVQWAALTEEAKQGGEVAELRAKEVAREEAQWAELEAKGYFVMADGTKSSDHLKKIKKARAAAAAEDDLLDLEAASEGEQPRKVTRKPKKAKE